MPCPVPSVTAQRLVLIVHAARGGDLDHPDIRRSWTAATDAEREAVQQLALDVGAEVALAAGTGRLDEYVGARGYELWLALSTGERSLLRIWMARVKAAPTRRAAVRTAVRLLLPNPHRMEATLGRPPTARELSGAYVARARWGGARDPEHSAGQVDTVRERTVTTYRIPRAAGPRRARRPARPGGHGVPHEASRRSPGDPPRLGSLDLVAGSGW